MQKRWSVNSMMLAFVAFALVLVSGCSTAFKMGFGEPIAHLRGEGRQLLREHLGQAGADARQLGGRAGAGDDPIDHDGTGVRVPEPRRSSYFQFVFAAITPILMLGSVLGRINFKAWIPFVLLWSSLIYTVNAFLIWGGGYFAQHGALDFSGGYVIHLAAGRVGLRRGGGDRAAPPARPRGRRAEQPGDGRGGSRAAVARLERLQRRRPVLGRRGLLGGGAEHEPVHCAVGVPRSGSAWDYITGRKPSLIGSVNGMITGLVAITPGGRLRQRLGRDRDRPDRQRRSCTWRSELRQPADAIPQRGRHARRGLHARLRGARRWIARGHLREPEDDPRVRHGGGASDIFAKGLIHGDGGHLLKGRSSPGPG